jgi:hypothetical protein
MGNDRMSHPLFRLAFRALFEPFRLDRATPKDVQYTAGSWSMGGRANGT